MLTTLPIDHHEPDLTGLRPSCHAMLRMAQWNLSLDDVRFVLDHGQRLHRAGAIFVYLRAKDIPRSERRQSHFARLEGATVVVSPNKPIIITVYRRRDGGLQNIKRKPRPSMKPEAPSHADMLSLCCWLLRVVRDETDTFAPHTPTAIKGAQSNAG